MFLINALGKLLEIYPLSYQHGENFFFHFYYKIYFPQTVPQSGRQFRTKVESHSLESEHKVQTNGFLEKHQPKATTKSWKPQFGVWTQVQTRDLLENHQPEAPSWSPNWKSWPEVLNWSSQKILQLFRKHMIKKCNLKIFFE